MFDPGLLLALDQIPSSMPQRPVLPIEQVLKSPRAAWAEGQVKETIRQARDRYLAWDSSIRSLLVKLYEPNRGEWGEAARSKLDQTILSFERFAEGLARGNARNERRSNRFARQLPPDLALSYREGVKLMHSFEQERVEALLDLALQFRAFRSTIAPGVGNAPVFDNSADLGAYLDDLLYA